MAKESLPKPQNGTIIALQMAWELGYMIALPLVIFALIGRYLDVKYQTSPLFILIGTFIAFFISSYFVWQKTLEISRQLDNVSPQDKSNKTNKASKK